MLIDIDQCAYGGHCLVNFTSWSLEHTNLASCKGWTGGSKFPCVFHLKMIYMIIWGSHVGLDIRQDSRTLMMMYISTDWSPNTTGVHAVPRLGHGLPLVVIPLQTLPTSSYPVSQALVSCRVVQPVGKVPTAVFL